MSLNLNPHQRAMLAEMGIRLWWPEPRPVAAPSLAALPESQAVPAPDSGPRPGLRPPRPPQTQPPATSTAPAHAPAPAPAPAEQAARAQMIARMDWAGLQDSVAGCTACSLCGSRKNTVFGSGDLQADWLIVGEAPGETEDRLGQPFVGAAGQLLDNMLRALHLERSQGVYIANVLKCRPPANRNPAPDEVALCEPYLKRQVALLQPRVILAMGRFAVQSLLQSSTPIGKLRGQVHHYQGVPLVVTYHPAYLLRNLPDKAKAWADLCLARQQLAPAAAPGS